jgi:hypothetical protein
MTAQELKAGQSFQYRQGKRWSNNFTAKNIIDWPQLKNILIETTSGRNVMIERIIEVRVA